MILIICAVLVATLGAVVVALGRAASDHAQPWQVEESHPPVGVRL